MYQHPDKNKKWPALGLIMALLLGVSALADERTEVTLLLPWYHQFQFAGYYAAEKRGYYDAAGLDVTIVPSFVPGELPRNPIEEVVFGRAEFGVARTDLLIHHAQDLPVVVLANIFQRSPLIFVTLERYGFSRLEDIGDRPVALTLPTGQPGETISAETLATLRQAGIEPDSLNNDRSHWQLDDLIEGRTELIPGFTTDTPHILRQMGETPVVISPRDYGVDFYGGTLFTSEAVLREQSGLAEDFKAASLSGWRYAMASPESVTDYLLEHYPTRSEHHDRTFLLQEAAAMHDYIQPDLIEMGYINRQRWDQIATVHQDLGLITRYDLERFLYQPELPGTRLRDLIPLFGSLAVVLFLVLGLSSWLHAKNRRLQLEIARRREAEDSLRVQAEKDALTGLDNRHQFHHQIHTALAEARDQGLPLSLIMMDVDHFKAINDSHGHLLGDRVLRDIAHVASQEIRGSDHISRFGGEEFAIVLNNTPLQEARQIAERIMQACRQHRVHLDDGSLHYTVSIGIAELQPDDSTVEDLINRADRCLYQAKQGGRDQVRC
ncbi:GGDEF domain-containing protein [Natronospirillum operosum]|uniref:GGDEF domain-containing protein n=1 Tax=Natronospirillum operosum TaxID=2759953 RepID=UPI0014369571|nr:GGDEF domain-containing protein [Natronospirillum operosum]